MSSRGATGAGSKSRALNINSVYTGRNTAAQGAGGGKDNKHGLLALGGGKNIVRRMPPPATLPSLKAEHGQDTSIAIVPQGGTGWTVNKTATSGSAPPTAGVPDNAANVSGGPMDANSIGKPNGSIVDSRISIYAGNGTNAAAAAGNDLRPNWARSASGTALAALQGSNVTFVQNHPQQQQQKDIGQQSQAALQQRSSSERDFPTLAAAASNKFQAPPNEISTEDTDFVVQPPIPIIQQPTSAGYIGVSVPRTGVERKLPERYCGGSHQKSTTNSPQKYDVLQRIAKLSLEKEQQAKKSTQSLQTQSSTGSGSTVDGGGEQQNDKCTRSLSMSDENGINVGEHYINGQQNYEKTATAPIGIYSGEKAPKQQPYAPQHPMTTQDIYQQNSMMPTQMQYEQQQQTKNMQQQQQQPQVQVGVARGGYPSQQQKYPMTPQTLTMQTVHPSSMHPQQQVRTTMQMPLQYPTSLQQQQQQQYYAQQQMPATTTTTGTQQHVYQQRQPLHARADTNYQMNAAGVPQQQQQQQYNQPPPQFQQQQQFQTAQNFASARNAVIPQSQQTQIDSAGGGFHYDEQQRQRDVVSAGSYGWDEQQYHRRPVSIGMSAGDYPPSLLSLDTSSGIIGLGLRNAGVPTEQQPTTINYAQHYTQHHQQQQQQQHFSKQLIATTGAAVNNNILNERYEQQIDYERQTNNSSNGNNYGTGIGYCVATDVETCSQRSQQRIQLLKRSNAEVISGPQSVETEQHQQMVKPMSMPSELQKNEQKLFRQQSQNSDESLKQSLVKESFEMDTRTAQKLQLNMSIGTGQNQQAHVTNSGSIQNSGTQSGAHYNQAKPEPAPINNVWEKRKEEQRLSLEREIQLQQKQKQGRRNAKTGGKQQQANRDAPFDYHFPSISESVDGKNNTESADHIDSRDQHEQKFKHIQSKPTVGRQDVRFEQQKEFGDQWNPPHPTGQPESHWDDPPAQSKSDRSGVGSKKGAPRKREHVQSQSQTNVASNTFDEDNNYEGSRREFFNSRNRRAAATATGKPKGTNGGGRNRRPQTQQQDGNNDDFVQQQQQSKYSGKSSKAASRNLHKQQNYEKDTDIVPEITADDSFSNMGEFRLDDYKSTTSTTADEQAQQQKPVNGIKKRKDLQKKREGRPRRTQNKSELSEQESSSSGARSNTKPSAGKWHTGKLEKITEPDNEEANSNEIVNAEKNQLHRQVDGGDPAGRNVHSNSHKESIQQRRHTSGAHHQKSPIISDGGNEEWETASESSDHGGGNSDRKQEKNTDAKLKNDNNSVGDNQTKTTMHSRRSKQNNRIRGSGGLLTNRRMGKPLDGNRGGRNSKANGVTGSEQEPQNNQLDAEQQSSDVPQNLLEQQQPRQLNDKQPKLKQNRKQQQSSSSSSSNKDQQQQNNAGQKNGKPASHTYQSSAEYARNNNGLNNNKLSSSSNNLANTSSGNSGVVFFNKNARMHQKKEDNQQQSLVHNKNDGLAGVNENNASAVLIYEGGLDAAVIDDGDEEWKKLQQKFGGDNEQQNENDDDDFEEVLSKKSKRQRLAQKAIEERKRNENEEKERELRQRTANRRLKQRRERVSRGVVIDSQSLAAIPSLASIDTSAVAAACNMTTHFNRRESETNAISVATSKAGNDEDRHSNSTDNNIEQHTNNNAIISFASASSTFSSVQQVSHHTLSASDEQQHLETAITLQNQSESQMAAPSTVLPTASLPMLLEKLNIGTTTNEITTTSTVDSLWTLSTTATQNNNKQPTHSSLDSENDALHDVHESYTSAVIPSPIARPTPKQRKPPQIVEADAVADNGFNEFSTNFEQLNNSSTSMTLTSVGNEQSNMEHVQLQERLYKVKNFWPPLSSAGNEGVSNVSSNLTNNVSVTNSTISDSSSLANKAQQRPQSVDKVEITNVVKDSSTELHTQSQQQQQLRSNVATVKPQPQQEQQQPPNSDNMSLANINAIGPIMNENVNKAFQQQQRQQHQFPMLRSSSQATAHHQIPAGPTGLLMEIGTNYAAGTGTSINPKSATAASAPNLFGNTMFTLGAHFQPVPPPLPLSSATHTQHSQHLNSLIPSHPTAHSQQFGSQQQPQQNPNAGNGGIGGFSAYSTIMFSNTGPTGELQLSASHHHHPATLVQSQQQLPEHLFNGNLAAHSSPVQMQQLGKSAANSRPNSFMENPPFQSQPPAHTVYMTMGAPPIQQPLQHRNSLGSGTSSGVALTPWSASVGFDFLTPPPAPINAPAGFTSFPPPALNTSVPPPPFQRKQQFLFTENDQATRMVLINNNTESANSNRSGSNNSTIADIGSNCGNKLLSSNNNYSITTAGAAPTNIFSIHSSIQQPPYGSNNNEMIRENGGGGPNKIALTYGGIAAAAAAAAQPPPQMSFMSHRVPTHLPPPNFPPSNPAHFFPNTYGPLLAAGTQQANVIDYNTLPPLPPQPAAPPMACVPKMFRGGTSKSSTPTDQNSHR